MKRVHPIVPLVIWGPVVIWLLGRANTFSTTETLSWARLLMAGLLFWSCAEYVLRRTMHGYQPSGALEKKLIQSVYGAHRASPQDLTLIVISPLVTVPLFAIGYWVFSIFFDEAALDLFYAAFLAGYLVYEYTHYAAHHVNPVTAWGRYLSRWHLDHHAATEPKKFGVTSPLWDFVFGTS